MSKVLLLVEDNPDRRVPIEGFAKREGYDLHTASSVSEAEGKLADVPVDLIIAHLTLPRAPRGRPDLREGLALLNFAREKDPDIQVILVTNYALPEVSRQAMEAGAFDFIDRTPGTIDYPAMLAAKARLALRFRELLKSQRQAA